jgi:hypothetical protein
MSPRCGFWNVYFVSFPWIFIHGYKNAAAMRLLGVRFLFDFRGFSSTVTRMSVLRTFGIPLSVKAVF